jgi:hypothetical protein
MNNNPEKDREKLERIHQKLKTEGDISPLEADFVAEIELRYWKKELDRMKNAGWYFASEPWGKKDGPLYLLYSDILKKLEKKEEGNFIYAIPFLSSPFPGKPKEDAVFPVIKECYEHLKRKHLVTSIEFSKPPENAKNLEKYFNVFGIMEFKTCGMVRRTGIPMDKMIRIPTATPSHVFNIYNIPNDKTWKGAIISETTERKHMPGFQETVTGAVLKAMGVPELWLVTYRYEQDVMIPKDMEVLHTLEIIRKKLNLVSMWEENFGDRFIRKDKLEKFAEIVLRESEYIKSVRMKKQHLDDEFLEITL